MIQQSLVLILFIAVGILLQRKIRNTSDLKGIKLIILNVALPATIFIALLTVSLDTKYLWLPIGALAFNLILLFFSYLGAPVFGMERNSRDHRTMMMLLPSLAPGLSCFPFLAEFLGEDALALGALADVGNKVFVLILCYMIALRWYQQVNRDSNDAPGRIKSLILSLINEPINLVIVIALVLVILGFNMGSLPAFLQDGLSKAAVIMTPLILIFIGLSVKLKWNELRRMIFTLFWRAGCSFMLSGILLWILPVLSVPLTLLIVVFPQSSVSFWPFAHMTAINGMDGKETFNMSKAIALLACSLPFSTLTIVGVFSAREMFLQPWFVTGLGAFLFMISLAPYMARAVGARTLQAERKPLKKYQYAK